MNLPMLSTYRRFFKYMRPYVWQELLLLVLIGISSLGALTSPYILKIIIDKVFPKKDVGLLLNILLCLLAIYTIRILSSMAADYLHTWISNRIVKDIRKKIFEHVLYMDLDYFRRNKTGDLLYKINNEVERIRHVLTSVIIRIIDNLFTMTGIMVVLCSLNFRLFLYSILLFPLIIASVRYFSPLIKEGYDNISNRESDILHYLSDRFINIKIIKSFNTYSWESKLLDTKIREWIKVDLRTSFLSSANRNISTFLMASGPLLVLWIGGKDLIAGTMTLGSLIAFIQYLNRLYPPALDFLNLYSEVLRAAVSMKNVMQIFSEPSFAPALPHHRLPAFQRIEFDRVSVRYDGRPVLRHLSLTLVPGKVYAIAGASGSGKSSLINLLCRFIEPDEGVIRVDDCQLSGLDKFAWTDKIALVSQDNNIFNDSLRSNIVYGTFTPDSAALEAVIRDTGMERMLTGLKNGLDSETGERGAVLSGGEVQRVMIARSLLKKADILILDEATSALDSISEESILLNIRNHYHPPIVVIISHRISTIRHADEVLYLEDGVIKERGSPERLLQLKGAYYRLFTAQLSDHEFKQPILQPDNA
jgi:ABC-type multidrug transport system fused ATPase/permease subunit